MNIILYDQPHVIGQLLPFTYTRPISEIRVGILKISEKWKHHLDADISYHTQDYLQTKYPLIEEDENLVINGAACPSEALMAKLKALSDGSALYSGSTFLGANTDRSGLSKIWNEDLSALKKVEYEGEVMTIEQPWHIFRKNGQAIRDDFDFLSKGRKSAGISDPHTIIYGEGNVFVEEGATVKAAIINAEDGPVYLGKNSQVHEGAIIKGPLALCEGAHINMGAKLRGDNTVGPHSKVGGEVSNSVIFGYSNKGHEGYLGNSVVGEWCNIGADTNTSNLKNNYTSIKIWSFGKGRFVDTGLQFCGLMMGDHAKAGINTMFNTGTVVGVGSNIFGHGFPRTFIPSFAWGGASGFATYKLTKMEEVAQAVMMRRGEELSETDRGILDHLFEVTAHYRNWENA